MGKFSRSAAVALAVTVCGTGTLQNAVANGDTRTLTFVHAHTGERGSFTFKKDGRYDTEVLKKLNWLLRDWRRDEPTEMDPHLFDVLWEVYRDVDASQPINVLGGYRSPATNSMLRSRSKGVAEFSQHMRGKAMDFFIPGVNLSELREAGLKLQRGGVGFYPSSHFVHMDTGSVRMWPRMSYAELARVFPDGKTVLVPSNGKPLPGYQQAVAELEARGSGTSVEVAEAPSGMKGIRNFFASLFKPAAEETDAGEEEGARPERETRTQVASAAPARSAPAPVQAAAVPLPQSQPAKPVVTALAARPLPAARPAELAAAAMVTAQAVNAPLAPLPLKRPETPVQQMASLQAPGVPLPPLITRGTSAAQAESNHSVLGYAAVGDVAGAMPMNAGMAAAPQPKLRTAGRTSEIPFGPVFRTSTMSGEAYMRMPEGRVFTAFMTAPREVVASGFGGDPNNGLSASSFSGEAIATLPTYVFPAPTVRLTQRLQ
ncbi:ATP-binding protein [Azorhizobium oxalatiphilum]|uniref:Murein endopeptidase K n=1 Tax=Azorhizobium oxalatiphilum TaxID=980631 RepID=A0A917FKE8_9HYPH|nr:DUF882 domain-containing protein [Azorhizobium oxalatiphilum]GGF87922.1 ATP-binding protein [Azorhizobium oxalatiphilum]